MKQHRRLLFLFALFVATTLGKHHVLGAVHAIYNAIPVPLPPELEPLQQQANDLRPLHVVKRVPVEGEWLAMYPEAGQSFAQYVRARDQRPIHREYRRIYVQPLSELSPRHLQLATLSGQFLELYYGFEVVLLPTVPLNDQLPKSAVRTVDVGHTQWDAAWINQNVLQPIRPDDAVAVIGLVTEDLWCAPLSFVFGVADPEQRVGVWSFRRLGNPEGNETEYRQCLWRTLQTTVHETGHILGFPHCTAFECCMNGSAHRAESDRQPLELCPECQAKVWWTCQREPHERWRELMLFAETHGLQREQQVWTRHLRNRISD